jgi:adenylylsulfate kinase
MTKETKKRSIVKAVSYRFLATSTTFLLAFVFTGSIEIATSISILDFVFKLGIYFLNERLWNLTSWGYLNTENNTKTENKHATESSTVETA